MEGDLPLPQHKEESRYKSMTAKDKHATYFKYRQTLSNDALMNHSQCRRKPQHSLLVLFCMCINSLLRKYKLHRLRDGIWLVPFPRP